MVKKYLNCFSQMGYWYLVMIFFLSIPNLLNAQFNYTHQDSLLGSITPERAWWDAKYYHLRLNVTPDEKFIKGSNEIVFESIDPGQVLQIDLQYPMNITGVISGVDSLEYTRDGFAYFIKLPKQLKKGELDTIRVFYEGHPREARNAPWDGGFSWKKDELGNDFIATSCQGEGASLWWPCKDHYYDEVDSMKISVTVPDPLINVSNGRLIELTKNDDNYTTYHWAVSNPINNYGVNLNIAQYEHFSEKYNGLKGALNCDYYVLPQNLEKAKIQFKQVAKMLEAFEYWFGPYPFYEDGFKLVEVPYLGMEHQSSVTYGNAYQNGYRGSDLSGSGWGLKFDFIIIHESGHEWFANNITCEDVADLWIHEGFTAYSEGLFVDYYYGKEASAEYVIGTRKKIINDRPVIGPYGVGKEGSVDMYYKGANILHMIRQFINDDNKWRDILVEMNRRFYHQIVTSEIIEDYIEEASGIELKSFFNQYLRDTRIPILEYTMKGKKLKYRYTNCVEGFDMPIKIIIDQQEISLCPNQEWQELKLNFKAKNIILKPDFYLELKSKT